VGALVGVFLYLTGKRGSIIGNYAIVDDHIYDKVKNHTWFLGKRGYPTATIKQKHIYLHRFILELTDPKIQVDHKDGNPLNNLLENLRMCSPGENRRNRKRGKKAERLNPYKSVQLTPSGKWCVKINYKNKQLYIGTFETAIEAAQAYDIKALELFGDFACLNFPENDYTQISMPIRAKRSRYKKKRINS
jgi:hypothetical protein